MNRNLPVFQIGFVLPDQHILSFFLGIDIEEIDRGAENHFFRREVGGFNHLGIGQLVFQFPNPTFNEALLLFRGGKLRIFRNIPMRSRFRDIGDHLWTLHSFKPLELFSDLLVPFLGHGYFHVLPPDCMSGPVRCSLCCAAPGSPKNLLFGVVICPHAVYRVWGPVRCSADACASPMSPRPYSCSDWLSQILADGRDCLFMGPIKVLLWNGSSRPEHEAGLVSGPILLMVLLERL